MITQEKLNDQPPRRRRPRNAGLAHAEHGPGISFAAHVLRKAATQADHALMSSLSVMDRVQVLAAREFGDAGPKAVAKLVRVSESAADALILGSKQVTDKVLLAASRASQVSGHWLLTGEGSMSAEPGERSDELQFLVSMKMVDEGGALVILFLLNLGAVLAALPASERVRFLSAVHLVLQDEFSIHSLSAKLGDGFVPELRKNIAQALFQWNIDADDLSKHHPPLFTPLHEAIGAFGPEQGRSLIAMLAE